MYEVELKVRAAHAPVRERLSALDAARGASVVQEDTYYDAPHREFAETDEALRIRRIDDRAEVTYKGPLVEAASKTRQEREVTVADADAMAAVLDALGFEPVATVVKEREYYTLDGLTVALDSVEGLSEFVEIETRVAERDIETAREAACGLLRDLGLDPDDQIRTSYLELLLDG